MKKIMITSLVLALATSACTTKSADNLSSTRNVSLPRANVQVQEHMYVANIKEPAQKTIDQENTTNQASRTLTDQEQNALKLAIEKGDPQRGYFNLAIMYDQTLHDYKSAKKYFLLDSKNGNPRGYFHVAKMYDDKLHDNKKAQKYYILAGENGYPRGYYDLALMLTKAHSYKQAQKYYILNGESGDARGYYALAYMLDNTLHDYQQAQKYYTLAGENGDSRAYYALAYMLKHTTHDYEQAQKYYILSGQQNNSHAYYALGLMLANTLKDYDQAKKYFILSAIRDHVNQSYLHLMYISKYKAHDDKKYALYLKIYLRKEKSDPVEKKRWKHTPEETEELQAEVESLIRHNA